MMARCGMCESELVEVATTSADGPTYTKYECWNLRCPEYKRPISLGKAILGERVNIHGTGDNDPVKIHPTTVLPSSNPLDTPPTEPARGPGIKIDDGKPLVYTEFLMQFPRAIRLVARVGAAGSKAPGHVRSGWKTVPQGYERYSDAHARHLLKEVLLATMEEPDSADPMVDLIWETATVAWNAFARLEHLIRANNSAAERIDGDPLA